MTARLQYYIDNNKKKDVKVFPWHKVPRKWTAQTVDGKRLLGISVSIIGISLSWII